MCGSQRFQGRCAIVTGAASGIGAATMRALLEEGAVVAAIDVDRVDADVSPEQAGRLSSFALDVSDEAAVERVVGKIAAEADVTDLINIAGIGSTTDVPDTPAELWDRVFAVNVRGTFLMSKHVLPGMIERGNGSIVNMASIAGLVGLKQRAAYSASKGAIIALTRAMAIDHVGDGVRVNCVCPGTIDSPWVHRLVAGAGATLDALRERQPMGRLGTPEEIAQGVLYRAGDAAAFVTGTTLTIDGGLTAA
jgi:2-keto-3-deoxy-L-fuconate dehydrogenase